jgi:hypothetical protein
MKGRKQATKPVGSGAIVPAVPQNATLELSTKKSVERECVVLCFYLESVIGAFYRPPDSIVL